MSEYVYGRRVLKHLALERFRRIFLMRGLFGQGLEDWIFGKTRAHFVNSLLDTYCMPGMGIWFLRNSRARTQLKGKMIKKTSLARDRNRRRRGNIGKGLLAIMALERVRMSG